MIQCKPKDLAYIKHWEEQIAYLNKRYLHYMSEKNFKMADLIIDIIILYEMELSNARIDYANDYGSQVHSAHNTRNKAVFVIKK